jgi:hypothetical protein
MLEPCSSKLQKHCTGVSNPIVTAQMTTYAQDILGLTAASLRIMSHRTLEIPINGPDKLFVAVATRPATAMMYVPTKQIDIRGPRSGEVGVDTG